MDTITSSSPARGGPLASLLATSAAVLVSALIGLAMATSAPGLGADFTGKWLTGWAIGLMFTLPVSWLSVAGVRRRGQRQRTPSERAAPARLA